MATMPRDALLSPSVSLACSTELEITGCTCWIGPASFDFKIGKPVAGG